MSEELKPCPFCGGEVKTDRSSNIIGFQVYCAPCRIQTAWERTMEEAARRWNRRVTAASSSGSASADTASKRDADASE